MTRFLIIVLLFTLFSCQRKKAENSQEMNRPNVQKLDGITEFAFNEEMHNFETLESGEIVVYTFVFTNTGNKVLRINDVVTDCGCVHAEFSKDPVPPGKTGIIEVEFDSSGLFGRQFKTIEVHANTKKPKQLAIFAEVKNEQLEIKY